MKTTRVVLAALVIISLIAVPGQTDKGKTTPTTANVAPDALAAHVNYLASPRMKGRGPGTPEIDRAAAYIAGEFKKYGLEPAFAGSYFQKFSLSIGATMGKHNTLAMAKGTERVAYHAEKDFIPLDFSESGEADLAVAFVGYGITSDEHKFDEYFHMDVKDKAVIVLRHEPQENDEKSVFAGKEFTTHSQVTGKAINARLHGARALVLVNDPVPHGGEEDALLKFGRVGGPDKSGLLLIHASRAAVDRWLAGAGKTVAQLQAAIDQKLEPQSFTVPDVRLHLRVDVQRKMAETKNVAAVLRGSDGQLAQEAVVVGAHYDHLGLGERHSLAPSQAGQVHPGADDNASGTAAVLELARAMAAQKGQWKRSVVFVAFSGEEMGLLGSRQYTHAPAWPLEKTAAMVNLDMVGRPQGNKLYVGGMGTSPGFKKTVEDANQGSFTLSFTESGYGSSDHQSFYMKGVPVVFFFSGLHADYHKPGDVSERINHPDHARVAEVALRTAGALAAQPERPAYVKVAEPPRPISGGGGTGYGPWFGSIPDMGEEVEGVRFGGVMEGSPAAKAGLLPGDLLVEFAGKPIKNLYDFTYALRQQKVGDEIAVVVVRGKERLTVQVTLTARR